MNKNEIEGELLAITKEFLSELDAGRAIQSIKMDTSLERELGIDSLGKVELFHRIEKKFHIHLPENAMAKSDSLKDLVQYIQLKHAPYSEKKTQQTVLHPLKATSLNLSEAQTLLDVIQLYGLNESNRPHIYYQNEQGVEEPIHYGKLFKEAEKVSAGLKQRHIKLGETVAIMLPTGPDFFYAFCGVILTGAVPVPIYPPFRPNQIEKYIKHEATILRNAEVRILITFTEANMLSKLLHPFIPSLKEVITLENLQTDNALFENPHLESTDGALIQYTSGSTGDPKGVYLTHANMLANIRAIGLAAPIKPTDVTVSWLPLYHDMGLMTWLASLYFGIPVTIMSPMAFLSRPEKWLWAIHYHRATMSGGPNFAYELCAKKIDPNDIQGLDLSSWRFAFNGAEGINPKTLMRFSKAFAPFGFKPEMFAPVYGLAESTVALTFPKKIRPPRIDKICREPFQLEKKAIFVPNDFHQNTLEFVACGEPIPDHFIRIVDEEGTLLPERTVGNLQFKGPSSMQGYYNNPKATQKIFHEGWWETGDLAYIADKDLFITGRKKDVIIKAGRNIYPEEIEEIVSHVNTLRKGCIIAFGTFDEETSTEKLIIVAETHESDKNKQQQIRANIIEKMTQRINTPPDVIVLVPIRMIPKTSSGKLQRSACKDLYLQGKLTQQTLSPRWQILKLMLMSSKNKMKHLVSNFLKIMYAIYIALILITLFPFLYISILFSSRPLASLIVKQWARIFLRASFCSIKIRGQENVSEKEKVLFVANHASYIDAVLLIGILPPGIIFTVKKELSQNIFIGRLIKKLGYITIDRTEITKRLEDKKIISAATRQHQSIVMFPEGTFTYATGLRPFKLGAFTISAETGVPICPIAIQGTRAILRDDSLLPTPGKIFVFIGKLIYPKGHEWKDILELQALARKEIARHCGEPAIDVIAAGPVSD